MIMMRLLLLFSLFVQVIGYKTGDRISAVSRSQHRSALASSNSVQNRVSSQDSTNATSLDEKVTKGSIEKKLWTTGWNDLPVTIMPRFRIDEEVIFHATVPIIAETNKNLKDEMDANHVAPVFRIDLSNDFKVSFGFDHQQLLLPWISIFDSNQKKSLKKLTVTFYHDYFDILRVSYQAEYGRKLSGYIDSSHPSLRGCKISYRWVSQNHEDFHFGVQILLLSSIIGVIVLVVLILYCQFSENVVAVIADYAEETNEHSSMSEKVSSNESFENQINFNQIKRTATGTIINQRRGK